MLSGRQNPGCLDEMDGLNSRVLSYKTRHNLTWMLQNDEFDSFFSFVSFASFVMKHRQTNRHCPWRKTKNWPLKRCQVWGHRWLRAALVRVRCPQINLSGRTGNLILETPEMPNSSKFILSDPNSEEKPWWPVGLFGGFFALKKKKQTTGEASGKTPGIFVLVAGVVLRDCAKIIRDVGRKPS